MTNEQTNSPDDQPRDLPSQQVHVKVTKTVTFVYPLNFSSEDATAVREDRMSPELLSDILASHGTARYWLNEAPIEEAEIEVVG